MNREHENPFPTSVDPDKIFALRPKEPEPNRRLEMRVFWFLCVPLGAMAGFFACLIEGSGGMFLPVWGAATFLIWSIFSWKESR